MQTAVEDHLKRDWTDQLAAGRSGRLDWLPAAASPDVIAPVLAAFANSSQGGTLLVGVEGSDTPAIVGVSNPGDAIDIALQAALMIEPTLIIPLPTIQPVDGKPLLVINVPAGLPHVYALEGRYLTRADNINRPLHPRELRQLLIERGEINFETEIAHGVTLDDIDLERARAYAAKMGAPTDPPDAVYKFLVRRGCLTQVAGKTDEYVPTNAGLLLFGKDVQSRLRGSEITAVRFAGESMGDTFNRQDIGGTLPDQIRRAETFLRDHLRKEMALSGTMERAERYEYPMEAARELVVNAVAHRDYSISGDGIRLYIFKDRMEITSPGLLPGPVTINNIADERYSRNPALVQVLADMGFIERLGYGVDRVIELMRQQSLRPPDFYETSGGFRVVLYNERHILPQTATPEVTIPTPASRGESHEARKAETPTVSTEPDIALAPAANAPAILLGIDPSAAAQILEAYRDLTLNPRQEAALLYLKQPGSTRITNSELQRLYPDVHAETIRRDLSDLVTKNVLVKMGEKRGSYYMLKPDDAPKAS
jgi:ATP-dependent DNA helicase RecG